MKPTLLLWGSKGPVSSGSPPASPLTDPPQRHAPGWPMSLCADFPLNSPPSPYPGFSQLSLTHASGLSSETSLPPCHSSPCYPCPITCHMAVKLAASVSTSPAGLWAPAPWREHCVCLAQRSIPGTKYNRGSGRIYWMDDEEFQKTSRLRSSGRLGCISKAAGEKVKESSPLSDKNPGIYNQSLKGPQRPSNNPL